MHNEMMRDEIKVTWRIRFAYTSRDGIVHMHWEANSTAVRVTATSAGKRKKRLHDRYWGKARSLRSRKPTPTRLRLR
jgi:hypothetical protein